MNKFFTYILFMLCGYHTGYAQQSVLSQEPAVLKQYEGYADKLNDLKTLRWPDSVARRNFIKNQFSKSGRAFNTLESRVALDQDWYVEGKSIGQQGLSEFNQLKELDWDNIDQAVAQKTSRYLPAQIQKEAVGADYFKSYTQQEVMKSLSNEPYFAQYQQQLLAAQQQLAELKTKYQMVQDAKGELKLQKRQSLAEKPFKDRFYPGLLLQPYFGEDMALEIGPEFSYYLDKNWMIGLFGHYRMTYSQQFEQAYFDPYIYGLGASVSYRVAKANFLRFQIINTYQEGSHALDEGLNLRPFNYQVGYMKQIAVKGQTFYMGALYRLLKEPSPQLGPRLNFKIGYYLKKHRI